jgi:sugar phosphate isomerase/epimerase
MASLNPQIQELNTKLMHETLELASAVEAPLYGVHMGYLSDAQAQADGMFRFNPKKNDYTKCLDTMGKFVTQMSAEFEKKGMALVLENLFPSGKENFFLGCSWEQICEVMSIVPKEVGVLLDLGHLNISATLMGFKKFQFLDKYLTKFGERLYEVHLSENDGQNDDHLPLKKDSWQLDVLQDIDSIAIDRNFSRIYSLEARNSSSFKPITMSMRWIEEKINQDIGVVKS